MLRKIYGNFVKLKRMTKNNTKIKNIKFNENQNSLFNNYLNK